MGATSVTGKGPGHAFPGVKGPGNERNIFVPLLSPHVVEAGTVSLSGGVATVTFPSPLAGSHVNYVVMLTVEASAGPAHEVAVTVKTDDGDGNFLSFAISGAGSSDDVMWAVMSGAIDAS